MCSGESIQLVSHKAPILVRLFMKDLAVNGLWDEQNHHNENCCKSLCWSVRWFSTVRQPRFHSRTVREKDMVLCFVHFFCVSSGAKDSSHRQQNETGGQKKDNLRLSTSSMLWYLPVCNNSVDIQCQLMHDSKNYGYIFFKCHIIKQCLRVGLWFHTEFCFKAIKPGRKKDRLIKSKKESKRNKLYF